MKKIPLTKGMTALVDDEDFYRVNKFKWHFSNGYAARGITRPDGMRRLQKMARLIMGELEGMEVDHISMDTLDNRRSNLRVATHQQNNFNKGKKRNNKSGHKGVSWDSERGKWYASIRLNGKQIGLGRHSNLSDAADAYRLAAIKLHGEFVRL
jgi:hypothetical protein